ncbi:MAG: hypothetical protein EOP56_02705 [Sphingobacteriales bacterium]|nr:MAG: hypothetical protein EOP56_02705 [Sphingobacteriales bacterium]
MILKLCIWITAMACVAGTASAQFLGGFFNQKGTQRRYMLQQIALYQVYLGYVKKGYDISQKGLGLWGDIRKGDLNLHTDYFKSLDSVNPSVRNIPAARHAAALLGSNRQLLRMQRLDLKPADAYENRTKHVMMEENEALGKELQTLLSDGAYNMTDEVRITRITGIERDAFALNHAIRQLLWNIEQLTTDRERRQLEIKHLQRQYEQP